MVAKEFRKFPVQKNNKKQKRHRKKLLKKLRVDEVREDVVEVSLC
jgi:hypothetical protein